MGKVVMYSSVSVDGFVADENDQPGPLFDWLSNGDVPLDESGGLEGVAGVLRLHPAVLGPDRGDTRRPPRVRHDGRLDGTPRAGSTSMVVGRTVCWSDRVDRTAATRAPPAGPANVRGVSLAAPVVSAPCAVQFVGGMGAAVAAEPAGRPCVEVAAGDVGGQVLAAGLIDEARVDVYPSSFGRRRLLRVDPRRGVPAEGNRVAVTCDIGCARSTRVGQLPSDRYAPRRDRRNPHLVRGAR